MKHYAVDDFINPCDEPLHDIAEKKMSLLYDFGILTPDDDEGYDALERLLGRCNSEHEMTQLLYDVLHGNCTLTELLQKKGMI